MVKVLIVSPHEGTNMPSQSFNLSNDYVTYLSLSQMSGGNSINWENKEKHFRVDYCNPRHFCYSIFLAVGKRLISSFSFFPARKILVDVAPIRAIDEFCVSISSYIFVRACIS